MILSEYNRYIFSIFSEDNDCLILTINIKSAGKKYVAFLQIHCTKSDPAGRNLHTYVFNARPKIHQVSSRSISFSRGRIILTDDSVKIDITTDLLMLYMNFTLRNNSLRPAGILSEIKSAGVSSIWDSINFGYRVKGNFVSPNVNLEFNEATGNIDYLHSGINLQKENNLLWSRVHTKDLDMAYSLIFNGPKKLHSLLSILSENVLTEFDNVECTFKKESTSRTSGTPFPAEMLLVAKNEDMEALVNLCGNSEIMESVQLNDYDFLDKVLIKVKNGFTESPHSLKLLGKAKITLFNNLNWKEFDCINVLSDYAVILKR